MTVRVLIVDDQEPFRIAARMVVEATDGFEVVGEAETGEDSVSMAAELQPDLVLMDVNLPGINGLDATRQILPALQPALALRNVTPPGITALAAPRHILAAHAGRVVVLLLSPSGPRAAR